MARTTEELIELVKTMSGEKDEVAIKAYLELAKSDILRTCYPFDDTVTEVPEKYEMVWVELTVYHLNKKGAEGQTYSSENGVTRTYENASSPNSILRKITPYAKPLGK